MSSPFYASFSYISNYNFRCSLKWHKVSNVFQYSLYHYQMSLLLDVLISGKQALNKHGSLAQTGLDSALKVFTVRCMEFYIVYVNLSVIIIIIVFIRIIHKKIYDNIQVLRLTQL